jgi:hypothetical protein
MKTELEQIEKMMPAKLFKAKFMPTLLKAIEIEATAEIPDAETVEGRKHITSLAYKVARSKTTIDDLGKAFVAEQKSAIAEIDAVRRVARDFLDLLKVKVRAPLTAWEDAEEERIHKIQVRIDTIKWLGDPTDDAHALLPSSVLIANQEKLKAIKITKIYAEYQDEAINAKNAALVDLADAIPAQEEREFEEENNLRRANEEAENNRIEEEQRIAREAVEAADLESTRELEEIQRKAAAETASQEARERDTHLKGKVHREVAAGIMKVAPTLNEVQAKKVVKAIVNSQIPHITINY